MPFQSVSKFLQRAGVGVLIVVKDGVSIQSILPDFCVINFL